MVEEGRLELIHGGWVSNDEAGPDFNEYIMNFKVGHDFLMKEFGITPKIAWHLD